MRTFRNILPALWTTIAIQLIGAQLIRAEQVNQHPQPTPSPHRQAVYWNDSEKQAEAILLAQHQTAPQDRSISQPAASPGYPSINSGIPYQVPHPSPAQGAIPPGYLPMSQFTPLPSSSGAAGDSAQSNHSTHSSVSRQSSQSSHVVDTPYSGSSAYSIPQAPLHATPIASADATSGAAATRIATNATGQERGFYPPKAIAIPLATENRSYKLKTVGVAAFEKRLLDTFTNHFIRVEAKPGASKNQNIGKYRLPARDGSHLELAIDRQNAIIGLTGTAPTLDASIRLLKLLDKAEESGTRQTELLPFSHKNYYAVSQSVEVIEQESGETEESGTEPGRPVNRDAPETPGRNVMQWGQDGRNDRAPANTATNIAGQTNGQSNGQTDPPPSTGGQADAARAVGQMLNESPEAMLGAGIVGPVQIQIIDELGTIVIRGERRDVAIVRRMIEQLENVSMEHEPEISLFRLRQADAVRVTQIVVQLYNQIYSSRRGMVSLTAMTKPNAVLLIGQKESIGLAVELIKKLDIPVDPESQFIVIRLRNASSDNLQTYLETFYADNGTLSAKIRIVSDFRTNSLIVQGSPRDMAEVAALVQKLDGPGGDAINVMKTFPLKNALASNLATILQNAITGSTSTTGVGGMGGGGGTTGTSSRVGSRNALLEMATVDPKAGTARSGVLVDVRVVADSQSNTLIVSAPEETMPLIETLIMQLDRLPTAQSQVKLFMIHNGDAYALADMLRQLFGVTTSGTGGGFGQTTGSSSTYATTRAGTSPDDSTLVGVRFAVDTRTNSIIATGSASDMTLVEALLIRLDDENMHNREVITFKLLNTPAQTVATALSNYVTQERQIENQASGTFYPKSALEQYLKDVVIIPETITNTLIVSTAPKFRAQIIRLVQELDERPPMVCIQVLIAEVTLTNGCEFGTELGLQDAILFDRSLDGLPGFLFNSTDALGNNTELTNSNNNTIGSQGITNLGVGRANSTGTGGFVFSASSDSVSILIRALEQMHKIQIISRPMLTTLDNKEAKIQVGETFAYVDNTNISNGTVSNSIDWLDTGIVLNMTPRITPDDLVVMDIYVERSKTGPENEGTIIGSQGTQVWRVPRIEITKAQSTISAMNTQTVIIGGLIHEQVERKEIGVPFLNKIPILKYAFNYETTTKSRKELVIIMTPVVIRDEYDMEMLKQQELARMNWCVADVVKLGGGKIRSRCSDWYAGETEMVPMKNPVIPNDDILPSEDRVQRSTPHAAIPAPPVPGK